jgi:DnaJ-class molecular chaperone
MRSGASSYQNNDAFKPSSMNDLSSNEAYDVLGLSNTASKEDVIKAHKRLMQRMHPDRGGSDYLAAKINAAKDLLIK